MTSVRQKKLLWVVVTLLGTVIAVGLILYAIREQTDFYFDPTAIVQGQAPKNKRIRVGGLVVVNSVRRDTKNNGNPLNVEFDITDCQSTVPVSYQGILPDLFRESSGIVATGKLQDGVFIASEVLAKHDENYMPPEVAESIKQETNVQQVSNSQQSMNSTCSNRTTKK